jgi:hypothetical protein
MSLISRLRSRRIAAALSVLLAGLPPWLCASPREPPRPSNDAPGKPITAPKPLNMVLLNVTVMDAYDRVVTSLELSNFEVFDDKVEQPLARPADSRRLLERKAW